ncbi:MAG: MBL fold metallo-hydrolase [Myxococcota bacterium]
MRIIPLGGAQEVGASSTFLDFGKSRFLVDAGIRIGSHSDDPLPDLSRLQEETGPIDAIILTHAHIDHSGALPLVHMAYPQTPIYMTPATYAVLRILLADSQRHMQRHAQQEREIPLYPASALASCFGCIRPTAFEFPLRLAQGEVCLTFHPAGHILGASSVSFQSRQGTLLLSGDISITAQQTIPGMLTPRIQPDVIMIESTYGDRLHAHRPTQEQNLIRTIHQALDNQGKVLIPAFAVGRAQEIIQILRQAREQGVLPEFPIYVDGMVQAVCSLYQEFPDILQPRLRHLIRHNKDPFFSEALQIRKVRSQQQREQILEGPPCCIIASSGMMTGGPSAFYAAALADNQRNLIAITGYQDEETPGSKLLNLWETPYEQRHLSLQGKRVPVRARVEKYALSAHADSFEITGLVSQLAPTRGVVLVHGDEEARIALASVVDRNVSCELFLPGNGDPMQFRNHIVRFLPPALDVSIDHSNTMITQQQLADLHRTLWSEHQHNGLYQIQDLYQRCLNSPHFPTAPELQHLKTLLQQSPHLFRPDVKYPHLYRPSDPHPKQYTFPRKQQELNRALKTVETLFPPEAQLYKKGARVEDKTLLLSFAFPHVAKQTYAAELEQLKTQTGWRIECNPTPHHAALDSWIRQHLPEKWVLCKNPSILHEKQMLRIHVFTSSKHTFEEQCQAFIKNCHEATNYHLDIRQSTASKQRTPERRQSSRRHANNAKRHSTEQPMEINRAFQTITEAFAQRAHQPYKKSKKDGKIILSFLSPQVGSWYQREIQELSQQTGWAIQLNPEPNSAGIKVALHMQLPEQWALRKEPRIEKKQQQIQVHLQQIPPSEELQSIAQRVYQNTGYTLHVRTE